MTLLFAACASDPAAVVAPAPVAQGARWNCTPSATCAGVPISGIGALEKRCLAVSPSDITAGETEAMALETSFKNGCDMFMAQICRDDESMSEPWLCVLRCVPQFEACQ
jgi:hypothetical protein